MDQYRSIVINGMSSFEPIPEKLDVYARKIVHAAYQVHSTLGPGLLESVYEAAMAVELAELSIPFQRQVAVPVIYKRESLPGGLRLDIWVDESVIVELKAVEKLLALHQAQLMTYMKLTDSRLGLLINFNTSRIKEGIKRLVL